MKTILLFESAFCRSNRLKYDGVFDYARKHRWRVQTIEYHNAAINRFGATAEDSTVDVRTLLDFWKPDGCIVECGNAPRLFTRKEFSAFPVVFLDRDPKTIDRGAICVSSDAQAIATTAAKELLALSLNSYAFIGWPKLSVWSAERGNAFVQIIESQGKRVQEHFLEKTGQTAENERQLEEILGNVPKPCGIFAANDVLARLVVCACQRLHIAIPEAVSIVGVDNDEDICEHASVSLTSIEPDSFGAGVSAAELLDILMSAKQSIAVSRKFGVNRLVRRKSACGFMPLDGRMVKALEFIRVHAHEGIGVKDVISMMRCSRRLAELRFREILDHTILDEIHLRRIEHAKSLFFGGSSIESIAFASGYNSADDFCRVFKRYTGESPLRAQSAHSRPKSHSIRLS